MPTRCHRLKFQNMTDIEKTAPKAAMSWSLLNGLERGKARGIKPLRSVAGIASYGLRGSIPS